MQDTRLVRTCVDGDPHTLVQRRTSDENSRFDVLFDLLTETPTETVAVTYRQSERFLHEWRDRVDRPPRNVGVVSVGEQMRSSAATSAPLSADRTPLRGVADPTDTDELRDAVTGYIDAWPDEGRTVVYFDSLTDLLGHLDAASAAAFLPEFLRALDARDAVGYFCLRPAAHDRRVVRQVASLFDTVVETVEAQTAGVARPSVDDCFEAVADPRRRWVLDAVADGDPISVPDLADRVAARSSVAYERAATSLRHVHLPKLAEFGMVAHDRERDRVAPGDRFERVEPYLRKALGTDDDRY
ncbi:helix-turn-helix domain-containing protein [Halorussus limi]|uniref:Helix-turn-helix domain-containing protein n=1 Tax=Halorussus limi TaxID=2938695 RepID=A0A8U0HUL3_9EURY|nr:helix-turn-helix domain-containing protein [Halorussus limi]UPV74433.1 helix-turn-helix domain-containing protein [Halorussus limi]